MISNSFDLDSDKIKIQIPSCFERMPFMRFMSVRNMTDSEFTWSTNKYMVDMTWHQTKSGSNNYTKKSDDYVEIANHISRSEINESHLINAVELMLGVDYVLPFENGNGIGIEHSIWNTTLNHIAAYYKQRNPGKGNTKIKWLHSNKSGGKYKISSSDICDSMTEKDKQTLLKYNRLDLRFYEISKLIEKADVAFYSL